MAVLLDRHPFYQKLSKVSLSQGNNLSARFQHYSARSCSLALAEGPTTRPVGLSGLEDDNTPGDASALAAGACNRL